MAVTEFINALQSNPDLAEKYKGLSSPEELAAQARADGYDVNVADLQNANPAPGGELSENELADVAGGASSDDKVFYWLCPYCSKPFLDYVSKNDYSQCRFCGGRFFAQPPTP
jgi:predicted ribosomally synthesized peptide with nif11-like leader